MLQRFRPILAAAMLVCMQAQAACLPPKGDNDLPIWAVSQNPKGCWAAWRCPSGKTYLVAVTKQQCGLVGVQRAAAAWLMAPDADALTFGADPWADPELRAVWVPEREKMDGLPPR